MTKHFTNLFRYIPPRDHIKIFAPLYNYKNLFSCPIAIVCVMFIARPQPGASNFHVLVSRHFMKVSFLFFISYTLKGLIVVGRASIFAGKSALKRYLKVNQSVKTSRHGTNESWTLPRYFLLIVPIASCKTNNTVKPNGNTCNFPINKQKKETFSLFHSLI